MADKVIKTRIQQKHETATNWAQATGFTPLEGELIVYDADSAQGPRLKIGDSAANVNDLPFVEAVPTGMYGVCDTAAATAAKTVTIDGFKLKTGAIVAIKFTNTNSASSPTLNVNGTGAYPMYRYGTTVMSSTSSTTGWSAGAIQLFVFDGTGWTRDYWTNSTYSNAALGQGYATCSTAAATTAKTASLSSYSLSTGGIVAVKFTYAVPAGATLNINSKGAKNIYYKGAAITNGVICAGEVATFIYDGTRYHLLTVDRNRFFSSLVPFGISIPENADLNTVTYLKVGNYYCSSNATTATLVNCPTVTTAADGDKTGVAFMLTVLSPLSATVDDESGAWKYRLRILQTYNGPQYTQYCYSNGTAGNWIYGDWEKTIKSGDLTSALANKSAKTHTHTVSHTPAGTVSTPTITVTPNTTTVNSITAVGSLPSLTYSEVKPSKITAWSAGSLTGSVSTGPNRTVTLTLTKPSLTYEEVSADNITAWSAGSLPTKGSNTTVVTSIKSATSTQPTFSGTAATLTTSAANS